MKAVRWYAPYDIRLEDVQPPTIKAETDAIVRPTLTAICGTDLHIYRGHMNIIPGNIIGHEFLGIVEEVGSKVETVRKGDRVLVSCWVADGRCWYCKHGYYTQCMNINIFGLGPVYGETLDGAYAEFVRVPFADTVLFQIPDNVPDEKVLFVGDALPAGFAAIVEGNMKPGDSVAVMGCGPIGLFSAMCAKLLGASHVMIVDLIQDRLNMAKSLGFIPINAQEVDPAEEVRRLTDGRGADIVVEAVGGSLEPLQTAIDTTRRKGTVSVVGFHILEYTMPVGQIWLTEKRLTFSIGDPIRYRDTLIGYIRQGRLDPSQIITHRLRLDEASKGFDLFDKRQAIKVVMTQL